MKFRNSTFYTLNSQLPRGDGPSALADPCFVAKAGETNRVTILIGKTYRVTCPMPVACVARSDASIDVSQVSDMELTICWPVEIYAEEIQTRGGASFNMVVYPDWLGGVFTWTNCCCSLSSNGGVFTYSCGGTCTCTGCAALGYYCYESYRRPANGGACGCGVEPGEGDGSEQDDEPYNAGASTSFSKSAVIFEDRYENTPGVWVERHSTKTKLHCIAHGGPNGGHVRFEMVGEDKLERVSGNCTFPFESDVGAGKKIDFKIEYNGKLPSNSANDIVATSTFTENVVGATQEVSTATLTSVKVRLEAVQTAPAFTNDTRHTYGIAEEVRYVSNPTGLAVEWTFPSVFINRGGGITMCPWSTSDGSSGLYTVSVAALDATYDASVRVLEPVVVTTNVRVNVYSTDVSPVFGESGHLLLYQDLYATPFYVSFYGVQICEVPDESQSGPHQGYYDDRSKGGNWSHTASDGAGVWYTVLRSGYVMTDRAGRRTSYATPWSAGSKTWSIPMSWGAGGVVEIPFAPNPTAQEFTLQDNGTFKIRKFGNDAERNVWGFIWKNGKLQW